MYKLLQLKIDYEVLPRSREYLSGRTQCVVMNDFRYDGVYVTCGVRKGSVFGPPLFLIYLNEITRHIESTIKRFADDFAIYRALKNAHNSNGLTYLK